MAVIEAKHLRRQPGRDMYAIGDVSDGDFVLRLAGIETAPHMPGHFSMQSGDRVGAAGESQAQYGHAEILVVIAGILSPQFHELFLRDAQSLAHGTEMLLHQFEVKPVVARGYGGMGSEDRLTGNAADSMIKGDSLALHPVTNGLQNGKPTVAFIQVQNTGCDGHGFESAEASDAKQQFLADSDARISAIQPRGQLSVFGVVAVDVGVEQEQVAAAHFHAPDFRPDGATPGLHLYCDRFAIGPDCRLHGQLTDVSLDVFFLLPAGAVEPLAKISLAVEQADTDERDTQVGGALDMVAGQHAQSAGIFRDGDV